MFIPYTVEDALTANSYITTEEFKEFQRIDFTLTPLILSDEEQEILLMNSAFIIDSYYNYKGYKLNREQNLEFPRDIEGRTDINKDIKRVSAQIAYDLYINKEDYLSSGAIKTEKFEGMEVEYFNNKNVNELKEHSFRVIKKYIDFGQFITLERV